MATFSNAPFVGTLINLSDAFPNAIPTTPIYANCHTLLVTYLQPDWEANNTHRMMFTLSANPAMTLMQCLTLTYDVRAVPCLGRVSGLRNLPCPGCLRTGGPRGRLTARVIASDNVSGPTRGHRVRTGAGACVGVARGSNRCCG